MAWFNKPVSFTIEGSARAAGSRRGHRRGGVRQTPIARQHQRARRVRTPPVTRWLRGFMDAEYVVTDSFHGILFAILFNKPFLTFGNSRRGMTRFDSILKKMQLLDRMVCEPWEFDPELVARDIDYSKVNAIRREEVAHSLDFLRNALANSHEPS